MYLMLWEDCGKVVMNCWKEGSENKSWWPILGVLPHHNHVEGLRKAIKFRDRIKDALGKTVTGASRHQMNILKLATFSEYLFFSQQAWSGFCVDTFIPQRKRAARTLSLSLQFFLAGYSILNQLPKLRNAGWQILWSLWLTKQRECGKHQLWPALKCLYLVTPKS